ncbi:hypothetical protein [Acinetobacter sp. AGC35]
MKIILMLLTLGGLTACKLEQVSQQVQQQQDVCEGVITSFLKAQSLENYQLLGIKALSDLPKKYSYQYRFEGDLHFINIPKRPNLNFQCGENFDQKIEVKLVDGEKKILIGEMNILKAQIVKEIIAYRNL